MNRIDRLLGIITFLQSKRYCTAEQLSEKFEISVRTVYRDVKALNEIAIPVHFEIGKGYFIPQGYFLPPLCLTIEEANALILLHKLAGKFADASIVKHSDNALTKIQSALRYSDKHNAEQLSSLIGVYIPKEEKAQHAGLSDIQKAIVGKTVLKIQYTDNHGKQSSREVEPVGLIFYTNQWHLFAWCKLKKGYRDFKLKMIGALTDTGKSHSIEKHPKIEDYMRSF